MLDEKGEVFVSRHSHTVYLPHDHLDGESLEAIDFLVDACAYKVTSDTDPQIDLEPEGNGIV